jgi:BirA family biotin operon repressor/biotin-[acetyl-CoA-carboxylase] ligase
MNHADAERLADEILLVIRKNSGRFFEASKLAGKFKTSEAEISEALNSIQSWGYRLQSGAGRKVRFRAAPDKLTATEISYGLKTAFIGNIIHAYGKVKSTNDVARELAESGAAEGTIVTAEEQTRGRGRLGRHWYSPAASGIYVSIILRPRFSPEKAPGISIMAAVALAQTLESYAPGRVKIKWPNDVLLAGKKVAGILTELSAERRRIDHLVVGIGINVNQKASDFPENIRASATSVRRAIKKKVARVTLLQGVLYDFEKEYLRYRKTMLRQSHSRIRRYSSLLGHHVKLLSGSHVIQGRVVDIDQSGCLILQDGDQRLAVSSGEISDVQ